MHSKIIYYLLNQEADNDFAQVFQPQQLELRWIVLAMARLGAS